MELPQKLTTDIKFVQHQIKIEIQTHQNMRIKHANDPHNFKLHEDLLETEKRLTCLGEKQNHLMKWLRKLLTSNGILMTNAIASSLGIIINGSHQITTNCSNDVSSNNNCTLESRNNNVCNSTKDQIQNCGVKTAVNIEKEETDDVTNEVAAHVKCSDRIDENDVRSVSKNVQGISRESKVAQNVELSRKIEIYKKTESSKKQTTTENKTTSCEPLTAEKERFLSAVGLVTRDILKELQNRRVERKRRSTANHTQFVYGSNWDISSKKRKKSTYLASSSKQDARQTAAKSQSPRIETPIISSKLNPTVAIFKTPLPVSHHHSDSSNNVNTSIHPSQRTFVKGLTIVPHKPDVKSERNKISVKNKPDDKFAAVKEEFKGKAICFLCHKPDPNTKPCTCRLHYHQMCAEIVEHCVACGAKLLKTNTESSGKKEDSTYHGRRRKKEDTTYS